MAKVPTESPAKRAVFVDGELHTSGISDKRQVAQVKPPPPPPPPTKSKIK